MLCLGLGFVASALWLGRTRAAPNPQASPLNTADALQSAFVQVAEKVRPAVEKYKGIGVRIEDSFLLAESGLQRLSTKAPRTLEDIERLLQAR